MSAWRFAEDGKRALIYITQANWVEGYGQRAVRLVEKGYLPSLLDVPEEVESAMTIGAEWLGRDHPAVQCLRYGVAVHHGKLPSPFLREVERLLASGKIKITAASPTLAQGLNLNAAVLLVPYLIRNRERISSEEIANVSGRAGRAFVDTEGLILHVMNDNFSERRDQWRRLVHEVRERLLESGLIAVIHEVIRHLAADGLEGTEGYEYLANAREAWRSDSDDDGEEFEELVAKVDSIILGLVDALDADAEKLPELLEEALSGSLWERQLERRRPRVKRRQLRLLTARARLIWRETTHAQRHGHYAMGVGLETGIQVDAMAETLASDLDQADLAALRGDAEALHESLVRLAKRLLAIRPFAPATLDENWTEILRKWVSGTSLSDIGSAHVSLIEDTFMYRLVWALEAVRVRRHSLGWEPDDGTIAGAAAACVDTGLPDFRMTLLVRAGLVSREAAQIVVDELGPDFLDGSAMRWWLASDAVAGLSLREDWPSTATAWIWKRFRNETLSNRERAWARSTESLEIAEIHDPAVQDRALVRVEPDPAEGGTWLVDPTMRRVGWLNEVVKSVPESVVYAELNLIENKALLHRVGPEM